jgi:hypothetical protein
MGGNKDRSSREEKQDYYKLLKDEMEILQYLEDRETISKLIDANFK